MKKYFSIAIIALFAFSSCGNAQVPAKKMSRTEIQKAVAPLFEKIQALPETEDADAKVCELAMQFVKENPNDAGVYAVKNLLSYVMDKKELVAFVNSNDFLKNDSTIQVSMKTWELQMATGAGAKMVDFTAEYEGKTTKLSDYVGKGKYVLVDFWASWCGPCRREIPNIIKVWEKYKGDKFEVLGVATWDKPEDTLKAIEQMGIKYPQMLNAQKNGSDAYGIEGIPELILFAPDGTIVARGLRGEKIEQAVAQAMGN